MVKHVRSHLATGKVLVEAALPAKALTLEDPGTKALAVVVAVAAIAKRMRDFFIAIIFIYIFMYGFTNESNAGCDADCERENFEIKYVLERYALHLSGITVGLRYNDSCI